MFEHFHCLGEGPSFVGLRLDPNCCPDRVDLAGVCETLRGACASLAAAKRAVPDLERQPGELALLITNSERALEFYALLLARITDSVRVDTATLRALWL